MSSLSGARLSFCLLRPSGVSGLFFCRQAPNIADPRTTNPGRHSYSRPMSAFAGQKQNKHFSPDLPEIGEEIQIVQSRNNLRKCITDPSLVNNILDDFVRLENDTSSKIIMECNPGPGVLTRAFLEAGYNVVALESKAEYLPSLKRLEESTAGQLRVFHCDFFRLDPWSEGVVKPPCMYSAALMERLGISEVPWASGVPVKVFAVLPHAKEHNYLWRNIYFLYQRLSIYNYGRIELNLFMSERQYRKLLAKPGDFRLYLPFPVLYSVACDVQLLHKEHISTFLSPNKRKNPDGHMCLVRITPRRDLFSEDFSPANGKKFINMVKQCLVQRKSRAVDRLKYWNPGNGEQMLELLKLPKNAITGNISPQQYKLLFEIITHSEDFHEELVFDDMYSLEEERNFVPC
ncbi:dimethyladenosine transferase 2, mitochondrial [Hyperolius riggenbachi]|uniref:dimethyladenosine transferase 2, mitochondrial n=1 Tax=Hyperolius riggenbachi TaxID=752182 RepID=UPI0035A29A1A